MTARVFHAHLYGTRESKYERLAEADVSKTEWTEVKPSAPFYLFVPQDVNLRAEYEQAWKITAAMPVNVLGFQTHRDHFAIDFDESAIRNRIAEVHGSALSDDEVRSTFHLRDNRDWHLAEARGQLRNDPDWQNSLVWCLYRPFDWRTCYFSTVAMDYPRRAPGDCGTAVAALSVCSTWLESYTPSERSVNNRWASAGVRKEGNGIR